ncbi:MmgE/PrpD family protein [Leptospira interrogans]
MPGPSDTKISAKLSEFVVACRWEDIPANVRAEAVRSIFNGFGTALGGAGDSVTRRMLATLLPFSGPQNTTVIGHQARTDMLTASFVNAAALNVFDFDDTHEGTIIHPTAPVLPAIFAFAEQHKLTGRDILLAFVVGAEVECRLGNAVSPGHYRKGWHITSTCGVFGAAAAVGKLLGLDQSQMLAALGIASAQSSGLVETLGSMAKSVGVGGSARGGLVAALMAKEGVEGPAYPLEGPRGFLPVMSDGFDLTKTVDDLGVTWELQKNMCKPYPCGVVLNPVIDGCLELREQHGFDPHAIDSITVTGHPLLKERTNRPNVEIGREAQVSAQHTISVVLLTGRAGVEQFSDVAVQDQAVRQLRVKVRPVETDPSMDVESIRLTALMANGQTLEKRITEPRGSLLRPLTNQELETKFRSLAAFGAPDVDVEHLIPLLWDIENASDAGSIMQFARP